MNHSFAVVSIAAADVVREYFLMVWRHPVMEIILFASLAGHILLGVYAVLTRRSFKMTLREWLQTTLPFIAMIALLQHVSANAIMSRFYGVEDNYELVFTAVMVDPELATMNTVFYLLMMIFIWGHGVIGINGLLSYRAEFYTRYRRAIIGFYWVVPVMASAGFIAGLKEISFVTYAHSLLNDDYYMMTVLMTKIPQEAFPVIGQIEPLTMKYYPIALLVLILGAVGNVVRTRYFGRVKISYPNGESVVVGRGATILEASRIGNIPHQSVCGGKGRCTTCRVRILDDGGKLPPPNAHETKAIERLGLDSDIRLACQIRPKTNISVSPMLNPDNNLQGATSARALTGKEQETVILFVDLRQFTKLAESKLPYDVVYILNKYYAVCGEVIESNGGRLDKFIGDGIMAIFDSKADASDNCRNVLNAASGISRGMKTLNEQMKLDFSEEMRFGMGIHAGDTIVGMMGYGKTVTETAVGDNVNVASRLEGLTKDFNCELVVSRYVAERASVQTDQFDKQQVDIRGRKEKLDVLLMSDASVMVV
jgi:adenylate cyclase